MLLKLDQGEYPGWVETLPLLKQEDTILLVSRNGGRVSVPALPLLAVSDLACTLFKEDLSVISNIANPAISLPVKTSTLTAFKEIICTGIISLSSKEKSLRRVFSYLEIEANLSHNIKKEIEAEEFSSINISNVYSLAIKEEGDEARDPKSFQSAKAKEISHNCDKCSLSFSTRSRLARHKETKHEGIRYNCNQCNLSFTTLTSVKSHQKAKHEGIRHNCDQCSLSFIYRRGYARHMEAKHGGIRYNCNQCGSSFSQLNDMKSHQKSKHEGIRNLSFTTLSSMKSHQRSKHDGICHFCNQCSLSFTYRRAYTRHMASKHGSIS